MGNWEMQQGSATEETLQTIVSALGGAITASLENGTEVTVGATAVSLVAANDNRDALIIQNIGNASCRVGASGVTASTGFKLEAGDTIIFASPTPVNEIFAIRDTGTSTTVIAVEVD